MEMNAFRLVSDFREKFLFGRFGPMTDDFDAPLPVFRDGALFVLRSPAEVHSVLFDLRGTARTMGMADFRGEITGADPIRGGAMCLSVDWRFDGLPQGGTRVLPVTYWVDGPARRPSIRMVELRPSARRHPGRARMPVRLGAHHRIGRAPRWLRA